MKQVILGINSELFVKYDTFNGNFPTAEESHYNIGPLVDYGAASSEIGEVEMKLRKLVILLRVTI